MKSASIMVLYVSKSVRTIVALLTGVSLNFTMAFSVSAVHPDSFFTPSKNIHCTIDNDGESILSLWCDTNTPINPLPPKATGCKWGWDGRILVLNSNGEIRFPCSPPAGEDYRFDPILKYGQVWKRRGFTCISKTTGLTCYAKNGKGFFLSRDSWKRLRI
jgi:hypothetical protein